MSRSVEECNRRMLRARDAMDRTFAEPLCIPQLARIAEVSEAHFIRTFRATFGETPTAISSAGASSARCFSCVPRIGA
jgi:transcriptional regulator GlxA family with amidase domain